MDCICEYYTNNLKIQYEFIEFLHVAARRRRASETHAAEVRVIMINPVRLDFTEKPLTY